MRRRPLPTKQIVVPVAFFALTLLLMVWSGQNPRVLLYAYLMALLLRMTTVWYAASRLDSGRLSSALLRCTRLPTRFDRGKPHRDGRNGKPAGLAAYVVGILTMAFMLGILQLMGGGTGFLEGEVLRVELTWAAVLAAVFWTDDLVGRQLIIRPDTGVARNLGYNTPPMNFLLAAIFLGAGVLLIVANVAVVVWDAWPFGGMWSDWAVLVILAALKYAYEIAAAWRAAGR